MFFPNIIHIATKAEEYIYLKIGKIWHLNASLKRQIVEMCYKMVFFVFRFIQTYHLVEYFTKDGRQSTLEYMMVAFCFYMIAIDAKALISYKILVREASAVKADKFTL